MSRLFFSVFFGKKQQYQHTPHEAHWTMTVPLMFLALGAAVSGLIPFHDLVTSDGKAFMAEFHPGIAIPSVIVGLLGIGLAYLFYFKESNLPDKIVHSIKGFHKAAYHKFYIDEIYLFVTKKIIFNNVSRPIAWFDRHVVDGSMNGISFVTNQVSNRIKGMQSGQLQQYAWVFVMGVLALALAFIYLWF
jgi:NADH-quinone oxidoreductase subunit L